jgi:hypothetical protein
MEYGNLQEAVKKNNEKMYVPNGVYDQFLSHINSAEIDILFDNQPERSKREDSSICDDAIKEMREFLETTFAKRSEYCRQQLIEEMRCSELYGNIEREVQ